MAEPTQTPRPAPPRRHPAGWLRRALALGALLLAGGLASAQTPVPLEQDPGPFFVDEYVVSWFDKTGQASIQDVDQLPADAFGPAPQRRSLRAEPNGALWFKLVVSPSASREPWFLMSYLPSPDYVSAFMEDGDGNWQEFRAGDLVPVTLWPLPDTRPTFRIDPLPDQNLTVYVRVADRLGSFTKLRLARLDTWVQSKDESYLVVGFYFGVAALILSMCLASWITYRDSTFGSYSAYTVLMSLAQASFSGLGGTLLYPQNAWMNDFAIHLWISLAASSGMLFVMHVTNVWALSRKWAIFLFAYIGASWVLLAVFAVHRTIPLYVAVNTANAIFLVVVVASLLITWRRGDRFSPVVLAIFTPLLVSAIPLVLYNYRLLSGSFWTHYSLMIGSAIESMLIFHVLSRRSRERAVSTTRSRALAKFDSLTGLANLRTLNDRLQGILIRSRRAHHQSAVLLIELLNYNRIRELGGREKADVALALTARRLGEVARDMDTAARISDSGFVLALEGPVTEKEVAAIGAALIARGLRPQMGLTGADTLDFMVMAALVESDVYPVKKIIRHLVAKLAECDPGNVKRIHFTTLPAPTGLPEASEDEAQFSQKGGAFVAGK